MRDANAEVQVRGVRGADKVKLESNETARESVRDRDAWGVSQERDQFTRAIGLKESGAGVNDRGHA